MMDFNISREVFLKKFGRQVKKLRQEKSLSLRQLAILCDIDHSDIGKIEKGQRNIKISTLLELAKGLGVHPSKLIDFDLRRGKK